MNRMYWLFVLALLFAPRVTTATDLTAATLFGCDQQGTVDTAFRDNTGPIDAAWDIFFYAGDAFDPATGQPADIRWLNNTDDHTIRYALRPGIHTLTFHCECERAWPFVGLNLFFDSHHDRAGISVRAPMTSSAQGQAAFEANGAANTMGWPITTIPGANTLVYAPDLGGIWYSSADSAPLQVTLKEFRCSTPEASGNLDLVGPHQLGASGKPDVVGRLVLEVKEMDTRPGGLLLWLQSVAGITAGGPDKRPAWQQHVQRHVPNPPFSFNYGGRPSNEVLQLSQNTIRQRRLDADRTRHDVQYLDPETGLQVQFHGIQYAHWKTVEWTLTLRNTGSKDTPIISELQALDCELRCRSDTSFQLRYNQGDTCGPDSFQPLVKSFAGSAPTSDFIQFAPQGGRPTNHAFPYFNLRAATEGVIVAVGWPGQWAAEFTAVDPHRLHVTAGQQQTHFLLHPQEEIRTPLIVLQFASDGDWLDAQNIWRQWMIAHNLPQPARTGPLPMLNACSSHQFAEMTKANEQNQIEFIDSYAQHGLKLDYWWMDAGWYVGAAEKGWPWTGTWEVDRREHRFPRGLRAISDHAHAQGVKTIVWFEPERVAAGTWLATEHSDWVLGGGQGGLLNLGDPKAWQWLVEHISGIIDQEGIDLYRQDFNIDPLDYWRANDPEDRQGITEIKYVMGYLAYWDQLRQRHPQMLIDSCASGGRRNDLETMRRAVPLLRSDYLFEPVGQQGHTYGLSLWLPFYGTGYCPSNTAGWGWGTGQASYETYTRRSNLCPANTACFDFRVPVDDQLISRLYQEWREVAPCYFGDYYPLSDYSLEPDSWIAWQFHQSDADRGMVQAFRRAESDFFGAQFRLRGLDPDGQYRVRNYDRQNTMVATGKELMENGLPIAIQQRPGAAVIAYQRINKELESSQ